MKKVLVSGCFDLLHAGHIQFLKEASAYGRVFVSVGTDENLKYLKKKPPYFSQDERVFILKNLKCVEDAFVASGMGVLDFEPELKRIKPNYFVVNRDGHTPEKERLCREQGVRYILLERTPAEGLPERASSQIKKETRFPYRVAIAGGWIDQPWVSEICSGSMVVASIYPTVDFHDRSGMATSSRKAGIELWGDKIPDGNPERNAKLLFGAENPPGVPYVSGSQDHIGLLVPGISKLYYTGKYWPASIENTRNQDICEWLGHVIHLVPLEPRPNDYDPLTIKDLEYKWVKQLGESGELAYASIIKQDVKGLGESLNLSLEAWKHLLPESVLDDDQTGISRYTSHPGVTYSGAGGGYFLIASDKKIKEAVKIKIRY